MQEMGKDKQWTQEALNLRLADRAKGDKEYAVVSKIRIYLVQFIYL